MKTNTNYLHAIHYNMLGLNTACICNFVSEYNFYEKNVLKSPCHEWIDLRQRRQLKEEIENYPWEISTGVAIIGGYNNLHVFDIDGCSNYSFIKDLLRILGLPQDYEWLTLTGSLNGYHIYFFSDSIKGIEDEHMVSTYPANDFNEGLFSKFEILWKTPIVASPSLHISTHNYSFVNCRIPMSQPQWINIEKFKIIECLFLNREKVIQNTKYEDFLVKSFKLNQPSDLELVNLGNLKRSLFFIFDTETDGLINKSDSNNIKYPKIIQISWAIMDFDGIILKKDTRILNCDYNADSEAFKINKLNKSNISKLAESPQLVYKDLINDLKYCKYIAAHNLDFDLNLLIHELSLIELDIDLRDFKTICTMRIGAELIGNNAKYPKLTELYEWLFNYKIFQLHNAEADALIVCKCCRELIKREKLKSYKFQSS